MPGIGDLVHTTDGKWTTRPPTQCPNGHELGAGHTTWTCRTCDQTVYRPPLNTHCAVIDGPAAVRISNVT